MGRRFFCNFGGAGVDLLELGRGVGGLESALSSGNLENLDP